MDVSQLVRAARRHAGLSQRALAAAAGVAASTVAAAEGGRQDLTVPLLDRMLQAAGLDLELVRRRPDAEVSCGDGIAAHLRLSLTSRLRVALGAHPYPLLPIRAPEWQQLVSLSSVGAVLLEAPLAERLWLPLGRAESVSVIVYQPRTALPLTPDVLVRVENGPLPPAALPVALVGPTRVFVLPPAELLLSTAVQLRIADRLLHEQAAVDDAGRRRPAHRDPDGWAEGGRVLSDRRYGLGPLPDPRNGRGWRLGAPASLAQQLAAGDRLRGCLDS